jgi:hypothetical protein
VSESGIRFEPHVEFKQTTHFVTRNYYGLKPISGTIVATAVAPITGDGRAVRFEKGLIKSRQTLNHDEEF